MFLTDFWIDILTAIEILTEKLIVLVVSIYWSDQLEFLNDPSENDLGEIDHKIEIVLIVLCYGSLPEDLILFLLHCLMV